MYFDGGSNYLLRELIEVRTHGFSFHKTLN